jgi:Tol biopolymer transport system component
VVRSDGTGVRPVPDDGWHYYTASWSPDGKVIVVRRSKSERPKGTIVDEDTVLIDVASGRIVTSLKPPL